MEFTPVDPVTALLGGTNLAFSALAAKRSHDALYDITGEQFKQAAFEPVWKTQLARETAKAGMAGDIGNRIFGSTVAPDLEFGRQREAAMFAAGPLGERQLALDVERRRREIGLQGSAEAKKLRREQREAELKQALAAREAQIAGMVGNRAPVDLSTLFV
jgi:hypothetical protein